jgi:AAA ATPase domain
VLFGRERELTRVEAALGAARGGESRVLLVRGAAGIGKSALLDRARERAGGMRVLAARGVEVESELAFAGLSELLGPLMGLTAGLPAAQATAVRGALALEPAEAADRFAVGVGTLGLLAVAAEAQPLLVLVEDLHWLDAASVEALAFAARRLRAEPIALLVSCREEQTTAFETGRFEELRLGGLDAPAASALLAELAGEPVAGRVVERLVAATGGNPLALGELAGVLTPSQLAGGAALPDPLPAQASAERLFADQIGALDREAQRALLLAAAAGEGEVAPVLAAGAAAGLDQSVFERVEAAGLIVLANGRLSFSHPLARSAAYAGAEPGERRAAHRALVGSFSDDRRAWHLAAGVRLSPDAAQRARRLLAAADAGRLAGCAEHALELLDEADEQLGDPGSVQAATLLVARARIERSAGRVRDAQHHYVQAAELLDTDARQAAAALAHAALAALIAGDYEAAVDVAVRARAALDDQEALIARLILGFALWRSGVTSEGFALLVPAAELAERPPRRARARHLRRLCAGSGRPARARRCDPRAARR